MLAIVEGDDLSQCGEESPSRKMLGRKRPPSPGFSMKEKSLVEQVEAKGGSVFFGRLLTEGSSVFVLTLHVLSTLIVWQHFSLNKLDVQRPRYTYGPGGVKYDDWGGVPRGGDGCPAGTDCPKANRYWARVLTPTLEFGLMHAIMLQMSVLPLTMCHHTLESLADTILQRFVPLHRVQRLHIFIGTFVSTMLVFAVGGFLTFFGMLCRDSRNGGSKWKPPDFENENDCKKFNSEIFITGMIVFGMTLIIGATSLFRARLPYWVFICCHQLVFVWFAVAIAHTVDDMQRTNHAEPRKSNAASNPNTLKRSQVWPWCIASLVLYWTDRLYMSTTRRFDAVIRSSEATSSTKQVVEIKIRRPPGVTWRPGQHFLLRVPSLSPIFHPFSCWSAPGASDDEALKFLIKVAGGWTKGLREELILAQDKAVDDWSLNNDVPVVVQGPYGSLPQFGRDFDHLILIGSGTGAVPVMSIIEDVANRYEALSSIGVATAHTEKHEDRRTMALAKAAARVVWWKPVAYHLLLTLVTLAQFVVGALEISWYILGVRKENTYISQHDKFLKPLWLANLFLQLLFALAVFRDLAKERVAAKKPLEFFDFLDVVLMLSGLAAESRWALWRMNHAGKGPWKRGACDIAGRAVLAALRFFRLWARNPLLQNASFSPTNASSKVVQSMSCAIIMPDVESAAWLLPSLAKAERTCIEKLADAACKPRFNLDVFLTRSTVAETVEDVGRGSLENAMREDAEFIMNNVKCGFPNLMDIVRDTMIKAKEAPTSRTCVFYSGPATLGKQIAALVYQANILYGNNKNHSVLYYDSIYAYDTKKARKEAMSRGNIKERAITQGQFSLSHAVCGDDIEDITPQVDHKEETKYA